MVILPFYVFVLKFIGCLSTVPRCSFFFELKGRSTAASYKEKKSGCYIVCDYIKKKETQTHSPTTHG